MGEPVKFTFNEAFDGGEQSKFETQVNEIRQSAATAETEAFERGRAEGRRATLSEIEAQTLNAMTSITAKLQELFEQKQQVEMVSEQKAAVLGSTIAGKLVPTLLAHYPEDEIKTLIRECIELAADSTRLSIFLNTAVKSSVENCIEPIKHKVGFKGEIILVEDASLAPHDVRVEWPDGGAQLITQDIENKISSVIDQFISAKITDTNGADSAVIRQLKQG